MRYLVVLLTVGGLVSAGYAEEPNSSLDVHFSVLDSDHGALGMGVLSQDKRPVACFGLTKLPGQRPRYAYLFVIKAAPARPMDGGETECKGRASNQKKGYIDISGQFKYQGKTVEVQYKADIDVENKRVSGEALKVGGKEAKTDGPRIFLVDLTRDKVSYTPVKVEEFDELPAGKWEEAVGETIKQLKKKSPKVKKFLE